MDESCLALPATACAVYEDEERSAVACRLCLRTESPVVLPGGALPTSVGREQPGHTNALGDTLNESGRPLARCSLDRRRFRRRTAKVERLVRQD